MKHYRYVDFVKTAYEKLGPMWPHTFLKKSSASEPSHKGFFITVKHVKNVTKNNIKFINFFLNQIKSTQSFTFSDTNFKVRFNRAERINTVEFRRQGQFNTNVRN